MATAAAAHADAPEALLARWRDAGDARALASLFDRTAPDLFRIALTVAPDAATAEEAVQETFLAVLEDPGRCDTSEPVMPWLAAVLRHKVLDARRRARRVPDPLRLEPRILPEDPADVAARRDAVDRVRAALDRLEEPYRTVALLRWEYGLEPGEIAHARGEPPGTVRSTLSRALERLRKDLGGGAVLALVLGIRPPDGLAAIRRTVLAKAGAPAAATAAGLVLGGVLVSKATVIAALATALAGGGLLGGLLAGALATGSPAVEAVSPPAPERPPALRPPPAPGAAAVPGTAEPAAPAPGAPPAAESPEDAAARRAGLLLDGLDGSWFTAWKVGGLLAKTEPASAVLQVVRSRWGSLPRPVDRQNLMKGYAFSHSEVRLEVIDLGARDPDPAVRRGAFDYLEPYTVDRLEADPDAYRTWRAEKAATPPGVLLARSADRLLGLLRSSAPEDREELLRRLEEVVLRLGPAPEARLAVLQAAEGWIQDPGWHPDPAPLLLVIRAARPAEDRARALFEDLIRRGGEGELRALLLAGDLEAPWAREAQVARLRSANAALAAAAAEALADLGDLRSVGPLVEALGARGEDRGAYAVSGALARIADVPGGGIRDAAWWREWWNRNRERIEKALPGQEER